MILVETSIWVGPLRRGLPRLATLLQEGMVLIHPWVIGELACGNLRKNAESAMWMPTCRLLRG